MEGGDPVITLEGEVLRFDGAWRAPDGPRIPCTLPDDCDAGDVHAEISRGLAIARGITGASWHNVEPEPAPSWEDIKADCVGPDLPGDDARQNRITDEIDRRRVPELERERDDATARADKVEDRLRRDDDLRSAIAVAVGLDGSASLALILDTVTRDRPGREIPRLSGLLDVLAAPRLDGVAIASLVLCCFLWGLNQVAAKVAIAEVPPLAQAALRSLGGAALVFLWARWRGIPLFERDGSRRGGLTAGALFAAEFGCIFLGLQYTTASRMAVFIYISPFVVALGMPFIARSERLDRWQGLGLVVAFGGVVWAFSEGLGRGTGSLQGLGDALGIVAAVLWGLTTLVMRASRLATAPPEKTLLYQLAVPALALGAAAWLADERWAAQVRPLSWGAIGFQTVIVTFASYLTWFWLVRHYPATRISAFTLLTPVFGLLAGVLLLGEPATPRLLTALAAVSRGIALVNRIGRRATSQSLEEPDR